MICDRSSSNPVGNSTIPVEPLIVSLLEFIDKYLPLFPKSLEQNNIISVTEAERFLNQQLVNYFNGHSHNFNPYINCKFIFIKDDENKGTNYKPDIGVTIWNAKTQNIQPQSFFQIECKRLPTPGISSGRSEKEYVIGTTQNTGGIERFKNRKHGKHLKESSLIGFVQDGTVDEWHNQINEWIKIEISKKNNYWTVNDYLVFVSNTEDVGRYSSICQRDRGDMIKIHHFLLKLN